MASESVGLVTPQRVRFDEPLPLACGRSLDSYELTFETYGALNSARSNAVLICHALSGHHHAAGRHSEEDRKPGWWDACIGPGKPIDTRRFFVVSLNNIGGCHGSTGPTTIAAGPGRRALGPGFPAAPGRRLGRLAGTPRGPPGYRLLGRGHRRQPRRHAGHEPGPCATRAPAPLRGIAAALKLSAQNIAFNEIARQAIMSDPGYAGGYYLRRDAADPGPRPGAHGRSHHLPFRRRHGQPFRARAALGEPGRDGQRRREFQVESYLRYQGQQFSGVFDANTYLLMTRALDHFDLARQDDGDASAAFRRAPATTWSCPFPRTGASHRRAPGRSSTRCSPRSAPSATRRSRPPRATMPSSCPSRATCSFSTPTCSG
jgi:homoserine O-acetyltransferase